MRHGAIQWIEIPAEDPGAALDFYSKVFDWAPRPGDSSERYKVFEDPSGNVWGGFSRENCVGERQMMVYVTVSSIAETLEAVRERGGAIIRERTLIHEGDEDGGAYAVFRDPAGNAVAIYEGP